MARGRKALPAETHALRGNAGRRKRKTPAEAESETPITKADGVAAPMWLKGFPKAAALWKAEAVPILNQLGFIKPSDHHALARWCYWLAVFIQASTTLKKGTTQRVKTTSGDMMIRRHPATKDRAEAEITLERLERDLGLNPKRRLEITSALAQGAGGRADSPGETAQNEDDAAQPLTPTFDDFLKVAKELGHA